MAVLSDLEPKKVFAYFEEICNIPHPSYHEEQISAYLVAFAKEHQLEYYQDAHFNVIMIKEATAGYEKEEPILIQGHMDMVCEKEEGYEIDFEKDPLTLLVEGDYITAQSTTLGADDGIALAYALAILDAQEISHPRLEVIFTVSEEVGMEGATVIDLSMLKGRRLLNLDSENEGVMLASCAGGCCITPKLTGKLIDVEGVAVTLQIKGLKGGHSGMEIDKGRANSNLLLGRLLLRLREEVCFGLFKIQGGSKHNAIPRETIAELVVREGQEKKLLEILQQETAAIQKEYSTPDPNIEITAVCGEKKDYKIWDLESTEKAIFLLNGIPNGVQSMSMDIPGLVETSLNLGVLKLAGEELVLSYAIRSSVGTAKDFLARKVEAITEFAGGKVEISGNYPAWEYKKDSAFRADLIRIYEKMYQKKPVIEAIHAGVECGILAGKLPGLDGVSIGPNMTGIHTTEERLSISSARRVYEYVLEVLKQKQNTSAFGEGNAKTGNEMKQGGCLEP